MEFSITGWPGRVIARLMRGLNERYLAQEPEGLKRRSEDRARAAHQIS